MGAFDSLIAAVNKEYDRRIKRASEIIEYGMKHGHGHSHDHDHAGHDVHADHNTHAEAEGAVIANVPLGAGIGRSRRGGRPPTTNDTP